FRVPDDDRLQDRVADVLEVVYLMFTEGYRNPELSDDFQHEAIRLARLLHTLLGDDAEVAALLALLLFVHARRDARLDAGRLVVLPEQDRGRWHLDEIHEADRILTTAMQNHRPGPFQIEAAIAGAHSTAAS